MYIEGRLGNDAIAQRLRSDMLAQVKKHPLPWKLQGNYLVPHIIAADGVDLGPFGPRAFAENLIMDVVRLHRNLTSSGS